MYKRVIPMPQLEFQSQDPVLMYQFSSDLQQLLKQAGSQEEVSIETRTPEAVITRGVDLTTLLTVALGAGGALTMLLSKDGVLDSLARVIEKYIESRKMSVKIKTEANAELEITGGTAQEIKELLKTIKN